MYTTSKLPVSAEPGFRRIVMVDSEKLEIPADSTLNIPGKPNVPICPLCTEVLEDADRNYVYRRHHPDTRWFWCPDCQCHLGYHRMRRKWDVDPYELEENEKLRAYFGLE